MAWSSGIHGLTTAAEIAVSHHKVLEPHTELDTLMIFGCLSAAATGIAYVYRRRNPAAMLAFAASLAATGVYGLIEGAWPLGLLISAWAIGAARQAVLAARLQASRRRAFVPDLAGRQARYREVYGSN